MFVDILVTDLDPIKSVVNKQVSNKNIIIGLTPPGFKPTRLGFPSFPNLETDSLLIPPSRMRPTWFHWLANFVYTGFIDSLLRCSNLVIHKPMEKTEVCLGHY